MIRLAYASPPSGSCFMRPHQLRHEHGVHDAARQQDVEHVRDRVGDVEQVGVQRRTEGGHQQRRSDEAARPRERRCRPPSPRCWRGRARAPPRAARRRRRSRGAHPVADFAAARIRRNRRTMIVPKSSATPVPRISQMTLLTRLERIGSVSDEPSGGAVGVGQQQRHVADPDGAATRRRAGRWSGRPGRSPRGRRAPSTRSSGSVTASSRTVTGWSSRLWTVAENRPLPLERITALGAGHLDRADPLLDPVAGARRRGPARELVSAAGVGQVGHRLVADDAGRPGR